MDLVNEAGEVAASVESTATIESLTVPKSPPFVGVAVGAQIHFAEEMTLGLQPEEVSSSYWCSNGVHIHGKLERNKFVPM